MTETTLDRLRQSWKNTSVRPEQLDAATRKVEGQLHSYRSVGIARKLARGYYHCTWASVLIILLAFFLYFRMGASLSVSVIYGGFGVVMGAVYLFFARYIEKSDFLTLPVVPAIERAVKIRMFQRRILLLGCVLCIVVLVPLMKFIYELPDRNAAFTGGIIGGIIGGCIGIHKEIKYFRTSRHLLRSIQRYVD